MSILIKGMEMPEACCACPCSYDNQCAVTHQYPTFDEWYEDKPGWCPLVPVPPHGRLIDADALAAKDNEDFQKINEWADPSTVFGTAIADAHTAIQELLKSAPTIIEAEEDEI